MTKRTQTADGTARAAVYTRVSTEDQARDGHSLVEQKRRGRELIDREGWTYAATFEDAGVSGALASRPALDRLLQAVGANEIDVVIVFALDRLSRDAGIMRDILRVFDAAGVRVVASGQELDRATPEGRLQTGILAEFAEFERQKIKARSRAGIEGRARKGKPWGTPRYPYRKCGDGQWEPDPAEVPIAMRIVRERAVDGRPMADIAKRLNRNGVRSRKGGDWSPMTVSTVLDRHLLGYFPFKGEWIKGEHEPLIDDATWRAIEAVAAQGDKYAPTRGGRKPALHLFTGSILRCSICFEAIIPRTHRDAYVCRTNAVLRGKGACAQPAHKREDVDTQALAMFEKWFLDLDATRERVAAELHSHLSEVEAQQTRAAREVTEKTAQLALIDADYTAGKLPAEHFARLHERLTSELTAVEAKHEQLATNAGNVKANRQQLDAESETLHRLARMRDSLLSRARDAEQAHDVDALRLAVAQAFPSVYLSPNGVLSVDLSAARRPSARVAIPLSARDTTCSTSGVPLYVVKLFGSALTGADVDKDLVARERQAPAYARSLNDGRPAGTGRRARSSEGSDREAQEVAQA